MPVLARVIGDVVVIAFGAGSYMPTERFGSAGFNRRYHLELAETDVTRIGLPICRTILPKDISDLQPWARQPPEPLFQSSPDGVILQLLQHLVWADSAADSLSRNMRIARGCAEFRMTQKHLNHPDIGSSLQKVRCKAVA